MENSGFKLAHLTKNYATTRFAGRPQNSNKGTFGKVINIAGSIKYPGAAFLSSISALKVGAGLVKLATNSSTMQSTASLTPDVTYIDLGENNLGTVCKNSYKILKAEDSTASVYSIGCGLDVNVDTIDFVNTFLKENINSQTPIIIDADAINILALSKKNVLPLNSIITPHPMELSRLLDVNVEIIQQDRTKWAWKASKMLDCIVLLKGHQTVIAIPTGEIYINTTGNSALAKAGMGDVLTGMIAGFCAQGSNLENAATLAVYIHGLAGEIASRANSEYSVLASNLINFIPVAIKETLSR